MASVKENPLHWNFMSEEYKSMVPQAGTSYYDMMRIRGEWLLNAYQKNGAEWDGFRIEKNKCDMSRFFEANKIPMAPVLAYFETIEEATDCWLALLRGS